MNDGQIKQSLLVVEDSEDDYEAASRAFKKAGVQNPIYWCRSGEDALNFLRTRAAGLPGLILLDLNMPGIDGRKTLQIIKQDPDLKQIPVVILTTSNDEQDVSSCYKMGANTFVRKPMDFDGLIDAVRRLKEYWFELALLPRDVKHAK